MRKELIKKVKRVVVKVGTSTLTNSDGSLNEILIKHLVSELCKLCDRGLEVVLVTSGAVGAGMGKLNLKQKPRSVGEKQALAAVGQVALMHLYERIFWAYSRMIAQLLLTRSDFSDRKRYLSLRNVCNALLSKKIIPIINENDPVIGEGIKGVKVGDNDTLSALVCGLVDANLLIILSDIDGLYDKNPSKNKNAKLINLVKKVDDDIRAMAGGEGSKFGTGGMATKLIAADMANKLGANLIIANGKDPSVISKIINADDVGTLFIPNDKKVSSRKFWLGYGATDKGGIVADSGAISAIKKGKSLLSVGISGVIGEFERGDVVEILDAKNVKIARGISNYHSNEIKLIKGIKSDEFEMILGYKVDDEIVHVDNMILE